MAETNAPKMMAAMWSLTAIAGLFVVSRVFLKWRYGKMISLDDWVLEFSWFLLVIYAGLTHRATTYGLGSHFDDIPAANLPNANKYLTIGEVFAVLALQVSKTSFAITLLRLVTRPWQTWTLWAIIASLNIVMGIDAIIILVSCSPTPKIWYPHLDGTCWPPSTIVNVSIFAGVYSGIMDLMLAAFPILLLRSLSIRRKEKVGVAVAMSMGAFAGVAAFIKSAYMPQLGRWKDVTYSSYIILIWAAAEAAITIIATCLPYVRLAVSQSGSVGRSRVYEVYDAEVHMDRVVPRSKNEEWLAPSLGEGKRVAVPPTAKRGAATGRGKEGRVDSWDRYAARLS